MGLFGCSEATNGTGAISQRIGAALRDQRASEVDLGKLTSFGWDRFFVFPPGTNRTQVCAFIGANRNTCGRILRVEVPPDGHVFLLFGLGNQVTHVEMHALANGQFDLPPAALGVPREAAVFRVRRSTSGESEVYRLEPK